ncbi:site-specific integrase [Cypionkella sinensis]
MSDPAAASNTTETFIRASISESTRRAYRADLAHFAAWGGAMPATKEMVARYLAEHADTLAPASLARRVATLSKVHAANDWSNPCQSEMVRAILRGIKRVKGAAQHQAKPLVREALPPGVALTPKPCRVSSL